MSRPFATGADADRDVGVDPVWHVLPAHPRARLSAFSHRRMCRPPRAPRRETSGHFMVARANVL